MNILLAIPAKGQNQYLSEMLGAIHAMSVHPYHVLYMADRPTYEERKEAACIISNDPLVEYFPVSSSPKYVGRPEMNADSDWFLTGYVRNVAISYIDNHPEIDGVVFIDGDCIPEPDLIKSHMSVLSRDTPTVTVGQRKEAMFGWLDQRNTQSSPCHIFSDVPTEIHHEVMFVDSGVVWTCNFGLNRGAISALRTINNTLYHRNETFSSDFVGKWGGEDGFIGLQCFYTGIPVVSLELGDNGIRHKYHDRTSAKYDHVAFLRFLEDQRERLIYLLDLHKLNKGGHRFIPRETLIENGYTYDQLNG